MTCKTKIVLLSLGCLLAVGIVWWTTGSITVGGGFGALVAILFGRHTRPKKIDAGPRGDLADLIEEGLEATEAQAKSELETMEREMVEKTSAAAADLEEKANAAGIDPDIAPWHRRT